MCTWHLCTQTPSIKPPVRSLEWTNWPNRGPARLPKWTLLRLPHWTRETVNEFLPWRKSSTVSPEFHVSWRSRKLALLLLPVSAAGAVTGSHFSHLIEADVLRTILGGVLIASGIVIFIFKSKSNNPENVSNLPEKKGAFVWRHTFGGEQFDIPLHIAFPLILLKGIIVGMLGIGGGVVNVPLIMLAFRMPAPVAAGTSALIMPFTAAFALGTHYFKAGIPTFGGSTVTPVILGALAIEPQGRSLLVSGSRQEEGAAGSLAKTGAEESGPLEAAVDKFLDR